MHNCEICGDADLSHFENRKRLSGEVIYRKICTTCRREIFVLLNPTYASNYNKERRRQLRIETFKAYGNVCGCCGESHHKLLQIDHIFNDGEIDRSKYGAGPDFYAKLKEWGYPHDRYQLLCWNCNIGKARNSGVCPHKE